MLVFSPQKITLLDSVQSSEVMSSVALLPAPGSAHSDGGRVAVGSGWPLQCSTSRLLPATALGCRFSVVIHPAAFKEGLKIFFLSFPKDEENIW